MSAGVQEGHAEPYGLQADVEHEEEQQTIRRRQTASGAEGFRVKNSDRGCQISPSPGLHTGERAGRRAGETRRRRRTIALPGGGF